MQPTYTIVNGQLIETITSTIATNYSLSDIQNGIQMANQNITEAQASLDKWNALLAQYNSLNG